jgi:hypothetical protein
MVIEINCTAHVIAVTLALQHGSQKEKDKTRIAPDTIVKK